MRSGAGSLPALALGRRRGSPATPPASVRSTAGATEGVSVRILRGASRPIYRIYSEDEFFAADDWLAESATSEEPLVAGTPQDDWPNGVQTADRRGGVWPARAVHNVIGRMQPVHRRRAGALAALISMLVVVATVALHGAGFGARSGRRPVDDAISAGVVSAPAAAMPPPTRATRRRFWWRARPAAIAPLPHARRHAATASRARTGTAEILAEADTVGANAAMTAATAAAAKEGAGQDIEAATTDDPTAVAKTASAGDAPTGQPSTAGVLASTRTGQTSPATTETTETTASAPADTDHAIAEFGFERQ
jgi:hypothetical protein